MYTKPQQATGKKMHAARLTRRKEEEKGIKGTGTRLGSGNWLVRHGS
jgi:hypothetical protein